MENSPYNDPVQPRLSETASPAVSWPAIWSGVFVALASSVVLMILGGGLGFSVRSPWVDASAAKTLGVISVIWLIIIQWLSSALGGYITGRLRTRWINVHTHEVFFRDTAHGFVTWAVATVLTLAVFTSVASMIGHQGSMLTAHAMSGYAKHEDMGGPPAGREHDDSPMAYYSDQLFRGDKTPGPESIGVHAEANRILARGMKNGDVSEEDKTYLAQQVAARTGASDGDARKRVDDVIAAENADQAKMKEVADNARKTASVLSLCMALALIVGAFVASISAALGGNIRDRHN